MELEQQRREWTARRNVHGADTPLGHRYSNAIEQRQHLRILSESHDMTLREIAELEMEAIL